jgi:signal transduction histidine kinase
MDESVLKQAFEPFFTTKAPGQGTGLGLATVKNAVSQLGGQLRVQSRPGEGTLIEVTFPLPGPDSRSMLPE